MPELAPADGSVTKQPVSRCRTQSLSIVMWAVCATMPGSWACNHSSRGGDVIDTQSPASS